MFRFDTELRVFLHREPIDFRGLCRDKNGEAKQSSLVRTPYITRE
jgi:hypothetical protein